MRKAVIAAALGVCVLLTAGIATSAQNAEKVRITGWALSFGNVATGRTRPSRSTSTTGNDRAARPVDRGVHGEEAEGLAGRTAGHARFGRWRFPGYMGPDPNNIYRLGTPIRYAMNHPGPDGICCIVTLTDRVIGSAKRATSRE